MRILQEDRLSCLPVDMAGTWRYSMLKLLIADDEKTICFLIARLLDWKKLGFEIIGMAYTGVDAFEMIKKEQDRKSTRLNSSHP